MLNRKEFGKIYDKIHKKASSVLKLEDVAVAYYVYRELVAEAEVTHLITTARLSAESYHDGYISGFERAMETVIEAAGGPRPPVEDVPAAPPVVVNAQGVPLHD